MKLLPTTLTVCVFLASCGGSGGGIETGNVSTAKTCSVSALAASANSSKSTVCMLTDKGEMVIELESLKAPISVSNFLNYVNAGFYNGTTFHRTISNFVIQGGGFSVSATGAYTQKATNSAIVLEKTSTTGLSNTRGTLAMARTGSPDSATSQFFINVVDNSGCLDAVIGICDSTGNGYAVFGTVIYGMDVADSIRSLPTGIISGMSDVPKTPVLIQAAYVLK